MFDKEDIGRKQVQGFLEKSLEPFLLMQKRWRILKWYSDVKLDWQRARLKLARTSFTRVFLRVKVDKGFSLSSSTVALKAYIAGPGCSKAS